MSDVSSVVPAEPEPVHMLGGMQFPIIDSDNPADVIDWANRADVLDIMEDRQFRADAGPNRGVWLQCWRNVNVSRCSIGFWFDFVWGATESDAEDNAIAQILEDPDYQDLFGHFFESVADGAE